MFKTKIGDLEIVKLEVPTVFYKSIDTVANAIEKNILMLFYVLDKQVEDLT